MRVPQLFITALSTLLLKNFNLSFSSLLAVWLVRVITLSLLLRTYLLPFALARISKHIRVRSISLRSVRGLYIRKGTRTYRVERISYLWSSGGSHTRVEVKVEGVTIQIFESSSTPVSTRLGLLYLSLSHIIQWPVTFFNLFLSLLDPLIRPLARRIFASFLERFVDWLPHITEAISVDIQSVVIKSSDINKPDISVADIHIGTSLSFQEGGVLPTAISQGDKLLQRPRSSSVTLWRSRFADSLSRSWHRAIGRMQGKAKLRIALKDIMVSTTLPSSIPYTVHIPTSTSASISILFNPHSGEIALRGLCASLDLENCYISVESLVHILSTLRGSRPEVPSSPPHSSSPFLSPPPLQSGTLFHLPSLPSPGFAASPASPLLEVLSASILSRRQHLPPCRKLKNISPSVRLHTFLWSALIEIQGQLSLLDAVELNIGSIKFVGSLENPLTPATESYEANVSGIRFGMGRGSKSCEDLRRHWLGTQEWNECFDPELYSASFTIRSLNIRRSQREQLLQIDSIRCQTLTTQWPSPWLVASPFIGGDPNASLLILHANISSVSVTEDVELLIGVTSTLKSVNTHTRDNAISSRPNRLSIPRIFLHLDCGSLRGHFHSRGLPLAILHTDGFHLSLSSDFVALPPSRCITKLAAYEFDELPLQMTLNGNLRFNPIFVDTVPASPQALSAELQSITILSIDTVDVALNARIDASIRDDRQSAASIDLYSTVADVACFTSTLCVELWHPDAMRIVTNLAHLFPRSTTPSKIGVPLLDRLPSGLSVGVSVARTVAVVTYPAMDEHGLSRGIALSNNGLCMQYTYLRSQHVHHYSDLPSRAMLRHKLALPEEQTVEALSAARVSSVTHEATAFAMVRSREMHLRSCVATTHAMDEDLIAEHDDPALSSQRFLTIENTSASLTATGKRELNNSLNNILEIAVEASRTRATFKLSHLYHILLMLQSLKLLDRGQQRHSSIDRNPASLWLKGSFRLKEAHFGFYLPKQKIACRLDSTTVAVTSAGLQSVRWHKMIGWIPIDASSSKWESSKETSWGELFFFHRWNVSIQHDATSHNIVVEGDAIRIHIPYGYILADLIFDLTVTFKAAKHLYETTSVGRFRPMASPEAELPKSVPEFRVRVGLLSFDAADDTLETDLGLIGRTGLQAAKVRLDREEAFSAKVSTILTAESLGVSQPLAEDPEAEYQFSPKHSVSIEDGRRRLDQIHTLDWTLRLQRFRRLRLKDDGRWHHSASFQSLGMFPPVMNAIPMYSSATLCKAVVKNLSFNGGMASFSVDHLTDFLFEQGDGLPRETAYSLLVPMHTNLTLSSLRVTLRDYPLPLVDIPSHDDLTISALEFDTDIVLAEEMGGDLSTDWIDVPIIEPDFRIGNTSAFSFAVPKTLMPVKTYANPQILVTTPAVTSFSWAVSYGPATQDLMRVVDSLTSSPRDSSPPLGFWDKMRLILHWTIRASFKGEVRYYMKGLRDPYTVTHNGAGFALVWRGNTKLLVGRKNADLELIQVLSDSMIVAIPDFDPKKSEDEIDPPHSEIFHEFIPRQFKKTCATFRSGVRFGVGFMLERTCGVDCPTCRGDAFHRRCRKFSFSRHYQVKLERKSGIPVKQSSDDSYASFRSDFIHLSISLNSSTQILRAGSNRSPSSLHLTPKTFSHFWSWWNLFDDVPSLPIRTGSYYPPRVLSPKFGRHIATIKYRIVVPNIFIMHGYLDDSRDTWAEGTTPWIGVKAKIDELQVDMHQRDEEALSPGVSPDEPKTLHKKPFYAAEIVLKGLDLRAVLAIFAESLKQSVPLTTPTPESNYRTRNALPPLEDPSIWRDSEDFVELGWRLSSSPELHLLPMVTCPRFTYFKRNAAVLDTGNDRSKFGVEDSHRCLLGSEPVASVIQAALAEERTSQLRTALHHGSQKYANRRAPQDFEAIQTLRRKITLLEKYMVGLEDHHTHDSTSNQHFQIPSDMVSPDEWAEFDHVYQIHCPKVFLDATVRDVMIQYYYHSRSRRGMEYRMAARAVRFIRDQAKATMLATDADVDMPRHTNTAQIATHALRKFLGGGHTHDKSGPNLRDQNLSELSKDIDPMLGWSQGVSALKGHCCLLLKPQVLLRYDKEDSQVCIMAAVQAKLQSFSIIDDLNKDDPISGRIMTRTYTLLSGLQTFAPASDMSQEDGCVPLEVLIDLRCEGEEFDRLVPQTDATFHYDKFNRLRLRNDVTSTALRREADGSIGPGGNHLQNQTDLIQVHVPRFSVTASDEHFQTISHIVTKLLLFSDVAHKTRLDKLETLLFAYDFNDLSSAAIVVADLQSRLRAAMETERKVQEERSAVDGIEHELFMLRAHIFLLSEELNLIFDAIKLAQDRSEGQADQKSALLLNASSSEISWQMQADRKDLLAKLVVEDIDYYWLSRQDSSTVSSLAVGNLQAFDGAQDARWPEILSKHDEPVHHPLVKRGFFLLSDWCILPPVAGITIYEYFELNLHPLRLQIDARLGRRIMEYLWPARRERSNGGSMLAADEDVPAKMRSSLDTTSAASSSLSPPVLRKLGASRSFTDLRSTYSESPSLRVPTLHKPRSSEALRTQNKISEPRRPKSRGDSKQTDSERIGDAMEMRNRSSQKTFVLVRISSLHLLLSIMKEESFVCQDARIQTRELEYRNQTWSFEELVNQFIPSDMSWKGWVKMAFHQPLVPVLPVARELISKTKWITAKGSPSSATEQHSLALMRARELSSQQPISLQGGQLAAPTNGKDSVTKRLTQSSVERGQSTVDTGDRSDTNIAEKQKARRKVLIRLPRNKKEEPNEVGLHSIALHTLSSNSPDTHIVARHRDEPRPISIDL